MSKIKNNTERYSWQPGDVEIHNTERYAWKHGDVVIASKTPGTPKDKTK